MNTRTSLLLSCVLMLIGNSVQSQGVGFLSSDDIKSVNAHLQKSSEEVTRREEAFRKAGVYDPPKDGARGVVRHSPETYEAPISTTNQQAQRADAKYLDKLVREAINNKDLSRASNLAVTAQQQGMVDGAKSSRYASSSRPNSSSQLAQNTSAARQEIDYKEEARKGRCARLSSNRDQTILGQRRNSTPELKNHLSNIDAEMFSNECHR